MRGAAPRLEAGKLALQLNSFFSYCPKEKGDRKKEWRDRTTHQILSTGMPAYPLWPQTALRCCDPGGGWRGTSPFEPLFATSMSA